MPSSLSIQPDTGLWVVRQGQWAPVVDPTAGQQGDWAPALEVHAVSGAAWKLGYLRPRIPTITITASELPEAIAGIDNLDGSASGTVTDSFGAPLQRTLNVSLEKDGVPTPLGTTDSDENGLWSFSFDQGMTDASDIGDYRLLFEIPEDLPWVASSRASDLFSVLSGSVSLAIATQPSGSYELGYDELAVTGTALHADGSPAPGTIQWVMVNDDNSQSDWGSVPVSEADGSWAIISGPSGVAGARRILIKYTPLPEGYEDPAQRYGNTVTFIPRTPSFTKGSVGETTVAMSTPGVSSAGGYQFFQGSTSIYTGSSTSTTRSGLSNYVTYGPFKVRAYKDSPAGTRYYSGYSSAHSARTGRPEKRDSGSKSNIVIAPSKTGSWRDVDGWSYLGDRVGQGTYGTYGSYRGVIDFGGGNAVRDALRSALGGDGTARQQNGSCTSCEVYLYKRTGLGSNGSVTVKIGRVSTAVGSGTPGSGTGNVSRSTAASGSGSWIGIGTAHGNVLGSGDGTSRSLLVRNDGTGNYAIFTGKSGGGSNCRLRLGWSWNYVTQTKQSGAWTS